MMKVAAVKGNGSIDYGEFRKTLTDSTRVQKYGEISCEKLINNDGVISYQEFKNAIFAVFNKDIIPSINKARQKLKTSSLFV